MLFWRYQDTTDILKIKSLEFWYAHEISIDRDVKSRSGWQISARRCFYAEFIVSHSIATKIAQVRVVRTIAFASVGLTRSWSALGRSNKHAEPAAFHLTHWRQFAHCVCVFFFVFYLGRRHCYLKMSPGWLLSEGEYPSRLSLSVVQLDSIPSYLFLSSHFFPSCIYMALKNKKKQKSYATRWR